jgi:hypothetical protein
MKWLHIRMDRGPDSGDGERALRRASRGFDDPTRGLLASPTARRERAAERGQPTGLEESSPVELRADAHGCSRGIVDSIGGG